MKFIDAYESIELKFQSANIISIEKASVTKEEWEVVKKELDNVKKKMVENNINKIKGKKEMRIEYNCQLKAPVSPTEAKIPEVFYPNDHVRFKNSGGQEFYGDVVKIWKDNNIVDIIPDGGNNSISVPLERIVNLERGGRYRKRAEAKIPAPEKASEAKIGIMMQ